MPFPKVWKNVFQPSFDWNKIKLTIRDRSVDFIWEKERRRPMIIPIIMDV